MSLVCTNKGNTNEFFTDYYSQLCCFDSVVPIFSESAKSTLLNYTETSDKAIMIYEQNDCCSISANASFGDNVKGVGNAIFHPVDTFIKTPVRKAARKAARQNKILRGLGITKRK